MIHIWPTYIYIIITINTYRDFKLFCRPYIKHVHTAFALLLLASSGTRCSRNHLTTPQPILRHNHRLPLLFF